MSEYAPWYVIAWRLLFVIPHHVLVALLAIEIGLLLMSPRESRRVWDEMRMH